MICQKRAMRLIALGAVTLLLAACATQPFPDAYDPPGILMGIFHGFISPFSLIGSFFMDIRVYAFPNSGRFYDLGFIIGAGCFFTMLGGASSVR